ncbi:sensor histidine kinase [Flexivirga caeni]|uniref:histidine kinase n=2 Tax=Flexivirga caeni TaxID=2294115 RepID=A0A3M9LW66_9MICO|nr:sensor histidine kinase [Flexivirga caeni]
MPTRLRGLRTQLTALTAVVVIIPLVVGVFVLATLLQRSLTGSLTSRVTQQADTVAAAIQHDGVRKSVLVGVDSAMRTVVLDDSGRMLLAAPDDQTGPLSSERPTGQRRIVHGARHWWRPGDIDTPMVVSVGVPVGDAHYIVQVAASQQPQHEAISTDAKILLLGTPVLTALAAALAWWVSGRALTPVDRMRAEVDAIEAGHLDTRVAVPQQDDEIAALAVTLNRMLDRLQSSQTRQQRFVADASHELRSPLATLQAATELAATDPAEEWPVVAPTVRAELERMNALIADLLLLARIEELPGASAPVGVDLDDVAQAEVGRWRGQETVMVRYAGTPSRATALQSSVQRIVRNLVDNGIRHAHETVVVTTSARAGVALLTVDDDGPGIAPADRERVFDRFVRLDESRSRGAGGSGLGLAIVRELARSAGGDVEIGESPLGGARFTLSLPEPQESSSR